jgi:hypothetical protein
MSATDGLVVRPNSPTRNVPPQMWRDTISRPGQSPHRDGSDTHVSEPFLLLGSCFPFFFTRKKSWRYKTY